MLRSKQTEERIRAVRQLARMGDADAQQQLLKAIKDRSNFVAAMAAEALAECADVTLLPTLIAHFDYCSEDGIKRDPGCHVRSNLAVMFGKLEAHASTDALRVGIKTRQIEPVGGVPTDVSVELRANCALALAHLRPSHALRDIALLLFDEGDATHTAASNAMYVTVGARKAAAQALSRLANPHGVVPLAIKLTYPERETPEVLQECMQAIVELEDDDALELLTPYLKHRDQSLAAYACLMIAQTRDPQAPSLIRDALAGLFGNALEAAILALTTLRTEDAQKVLEELRHSHRKDVKQIIGSLLPTE